MARRPVFISKASGKPMVEPVSVEFIWYPGMAKTQKQKSICSLHKAAMRTDNGIKKILEISGKSECKLGVRLSAFNLRMRSPSGDQASVEVLFQGSKVFEKGGPYTDIYKKSSRKAKKDDRLKDSGDLLYFQYCCSKWLPEPQTAFYDWLYLSALDQNPDIAGQLVEYNGYTDIEFNPKKSINCQAASAALYKALVDRGMLTLALSSPGEFLKIYEGQKKQSGPMQGSLL